MTTVRRNAVLKEYIMVCHSHKLFTNKGDVGRQLYHFLSERKECDRAQYQNMKNAFEMDWTHPTYSSNGDITEIKEDRSQ